MNNLPIAIFDSGFGGLTVMRAIREALPHENIVYFGDTAHVPYGNKSASAIVRYTMEGVGHLTRQPVKLLVIACHTASAFALKDVEASLSIPVQGIIQPAIDRMKTLADLKNIAILGTRATILSGVYQQHLLSSFPHVNVMPIACPLFVPIVEEGYAEHPLSEAVVHEYLRPLRNGNMEAALLGCTHYPLLKTIIQKELGEGVHLIDPALSCAESVQQLLSMRDLLNPQSDLPHYQFCVSDDPEKFRLLGKTFLNYPIEHVSLF
jgi:glutamate racemase